MGRRDAVAADWLKGQALGCQSCLQPERQSPGGAPAQRPTQPPQSPIQHPLTHKLQPGVHRPKTAGHRQQPVKTGRQLLRQEMQEIGADPTKRDSSHSNWARDGGHVNGQTPDHNARLAADPDCGQGALSDHRASDASDRRPCRHQIRHRRNRAGQVRRWRVATAARKSFALGGVAEAATFLLLQRVTRVARALTCSASRLFCSGNSSSRAATLAGKEQEQPPETSLQPPLV